MTSSNNARRLLVIHDKSETREVELTEEAYSLGRAKDNDISLSVTTVSAHHAAVVLRDNEYWLQDLLSTNGTYINGRRVQRRRLRNGDTIKLADCTIEYTEQVDRAGQKTKVYSGAMLEQAAAYDSGQTPVTRLRHRRGEAGEIPFRTGRFFSSDGKWFFSTREGDNVGPFQSLHDARAAMVEYGRKVGFLAAFDDDLYLH